MLEITLYKGALYLSCRKMQSISYLSSIKVPIELIFYNAMESTDDIFEQVIVQGKSRHQYKSRLLSKEDLSLIGVKENVRSIQSLNEVQSVIVDLIDRGNVVFLPLDQFYFPHRGHYLKRHVFHTFTISSYHKTSKNTYFYVHDFDPEFTGDVSGELITTSLEHWKAPINLFYYDIERRNNLQKNIIEENFLKLIQKFNDSYHLYDWIPSLIEENPDYKLLNSLDHALAVLAGSRNLFKNYLIAINYNEPIVVKLKEFCHCAELLKNVLLKYSITGRVNKEKIEISVQKLKAYDENIMFSINRELLLSKSDG
ncbi:MAG: hypothetical protein E6230_17190 [Paenibacillus dendritiformis]|uniref:hypothetical protein n=1 Tax=Paenibacillus dendritiformis TaxID=130049 RepID=UPI00143D864A|nr:hypothetical protein [Paenibacillus dendritiformis]MDU5143905.1 hypothetical protein [Paenibacillus dendritiformis]NKI20672.1 hypothetical protein [Paenibacillus dendritiformis]NRF96558.1 hypothetical protein [Paenibacillus dendritiformis]GIO76088.1 hypothetical protein J27TS7_56020 [Paenibacillus dendritiformis]